MLRLRAVALHQAVGCRAQAVVCAGTKPSLVGLVFGVAVVDWGRVSRSKKAQRTGCVTSFFFLWAGSKVLAPMPFRNGESTVKEMKVPHQKSIGSVKKENAMLTRDLMLHNSHPVISGIGKITAFSEG